MSSRLCVAGLVVLGAALSGCVQGPSYPLMTPLRVAQTFGYDEKPLGANHYDVVYVAPTEVSPGFHYAQSPAELGQKDLAFDLASYRSAQLALQAGYRGFDIVDRHSSTDEQSLGPDYWGDEWGWGGGWHGGYGWHGRYGGGFRRWDSGLYDSPEHTVQVEVKLTVAFINDIKPGTYDASSVISQVKAHYPSVDGASPPATPPGAMPPKSPTDGGTVQPSGAIVQPNHMSTSGA